MRPSLHYPQFNRYHNSATYVSPTLGSPTINLGACFKSSAAVNVVAESQYAFRGAAKGSKYKYVVINRSS